MKRTVGRDRGVAAALASRVAPPTGVVSGRVLPVRALLAALLRAGGVQRGSVVAIEASPGVPGTTSLALALAAGPSQAGSWIAAVGWDALGAVAAAELGLDLERLSWSPSGRTGSVHWRRCSPRSSTASISVADAVARAHVPAAELPVFDLLTSLCT